jgi:hypothetical protein
MAVPHFYGYENKDEINHMEWFRMVMEYGIIPFGVAFYVSGGASKWWNIFDEDTKLYSKWENFEELFSNK